MKSALRPYVMRARADAVAANRRRIVDSARELFMAHSFDDITIDMVAADAETTARTVLRLFESKDELFAHALHSIGQFRPGPIVPGDVAALVGGTYAFYEKIGDTVIRWLADEQRIPVMHAHLEIGRRHLREWVAEAFAPALVRVQGAARRERLDALIVAFDVYTWKLLRRDFGLSQRAAAATAVRIVRGLIGEDQNG